MENRYYTPSIEEFRVGFEYQVNYLEGIKDSGVEVREWTDTYIHDSIHQLFAETKRLKDEPENIRVKFLGKDDIESLGFKHKDSITINRDIYENTEDSFLRLSVTYGEYPKVSVYHYGGWETPDMIIKNKSELKVLLKQLQILK